VQQGGDSLTPGVQLAVGDAATVGDMLLARALVGDMLLARALVGDMLLARALVGDDQGR
jgi:hypothetical protein